MTWFGLLAEGKLSSATLLDFQKRSGLKIASADGILEEDLPPIQRWLNRILALPIAMQNAIFHEFLALVEARVSAARDAGTLDVGVETIQVESASVAEDIVLRTDERTGATSHLLRIDLTTRYQPTTLERVLKRREWSDGCILMRNTKSDKAALCEPSRHFMTEKGELIQRVILHRPLRREYHQLRDLEESAWVECAEPRFAQLWEAEAEDSASRLHTETVHLATGLLLPIWSNLPRDYLEVNRIVDLEGRSWLGRIVYDTDVADVLKAFGVNSSVKLTDEAVVNPEFEERLSFDIEARGVLQNLIVAKAKKRGRFEVIGGGKRMRAMHRIVERGAMEANFEVPCLVIDRREHNASEVSLAENFQRLQMTPAEECQAFQHFIKEDGDTAAVAKRFGLTQRFVDGRLRLGPPPSHVLRPSLRRRSGR